MKIRVLTFSSAINYGALLQTYALSKVLQKEGHVVELYRSSLFKSFIEEWMRIHSYARFVRDFQQKYLPPFIPLTAKPEADCYIVGSDQVWNPFFLSFCGHLFFFDFLPDTCKRIAYAASFGEDAWEFPDISRHAIANLLNKFSHISLREKSSVSRFEKEFGIRAQFVLDPTLVWIDYSELTGPIVRQNTLISFKFNQSGDYYGCLQKISKELDLNLIRLDSRYFKFKGKEYINRYCSVSRWVKEIAESEFVVTDSFHGMVFAILYKRPFIALPSSPSKNGRMLSLLDFLGLSERYYNSCQEILMNKKWKMKIDYDSVENKLDELRKISLTFLKEALVDPQN